MIFNVRNASAKKIRKGPEGLLFHTHSGRSAARRDCGHRDVFPGTACGGISERVRGGGGGGGALRVQLVALFFQPMTVCANMMFQSIWKNGRAMLLAMLRNLMYYSEKRLTVPA